MYTYFFCMYVRMMLCFSAVFICCCGGRFSPSQRDIEVLYVLYVVFGVVL